MWTDNETTADLLGFKVHSDLLREVVTDPSLLPSVIGVFGDWGGGKSSIMRMLEEDLKEEPNVACLYFNGWTFEGYEDAKTALLTSILVSLGENKQFGAKIRDKVGGLLRRVKWMDIGRAALTHVGMPLAVGAMTGGVGLVPALAGSMAMTAAQSAAKAATGDGKEGDPKWSDYLKEEEEQPDLLEVRKFRDEFSTMLEDTGLSSLVILIDDLDRCLPPRIIDTLEAIKLFVAVPKTAFVIGADPRIVEHAISTRYARIQTEGTKDEYNLTKDYLEKLIQIPYHLPRLSPGEMEGYINLLLCQKQLPPDAHALVVQKCMEKRSQNQYVAFGGGAIREAVGNDNFPSELADQLTWSARVAGPLTEGLKGNPRQVKRMLNAMQLRQKLSKVANLKVQPDVLAKLMVLEYTRDDLFRTLGEWQASSDGYPEKFKEIEEKALDGHSLDATPLWNSPQVIRWLKLEPYLATIDLRDYYWVARDRTKSTLSEASMVPPLVNAIYRQFIDGDEAEQGLAAKEAVQLEAGDQGHLLRLLEKQLQLHPDQDAAPDGLKLLVEEGMNGADMVLLNALASANPSALSPSAVQNAAALHATHPHLKPAIADMLRSVSSDENTAAGAAAKIALEEL